MSTPVSSHDGDERTLSRALTHWIRSDLVASINTMSASLLRTEDRATKIALADVIKMLEQRVEVHSAMAMPDHHGLTDAAEKFRRLSRATSRSLLEPVGIRLVLRTDDVLPLEAQRCWRLALSVYELVSNAARHAHFDGDDAFIKIRLSASGATANCIVADNGSAPDRLTPGRGLKMVTDLVRSLGGRLEYGSGARFSSFLLVFPLTAREQRANRLAAERRSRRARGRPAIRPRSTPDTGRLSIAQIPDGLETIVLDGSNDAPRPA